MHRILAALALAIMAALASPAVASPLFFMSPRMGSTGGDLPWWFRLILVGLIISIFVQLAVICWSMWREARRSRSIGAPLTLALLFAVMFCGLAACGAVTAALAADSDGTRPDPRLTPGEVRTTDRHEICGHSTREFRNVSVTTKVAARRAYGISGPHGGWCAEGDGCEIDHRVPLTVGGGNTPGSIRNLWPQRSSGPWGFHVKDRCEAAVGRAICSGKITVEAAQAIFLGDWTVGCAPFLKRSGSR